MAVITPQCTSEAGCHHGATSEIIFLVLLGLAIVSVSLAWAWVRWGRPWRERVLARRRDIHGLPRR